MAEISAETAARGYLRIGELARRTGVSPDVLRAWERRYDLLHPERTTGGFRLYSDADEARVRAMQAHLENGLSAAEAARLALTADLQAAPASGDADPAALEAYRAVLAQSLADFDEVAAQEALDRLIATFSLDTVLADVVLPYLHELGDGWAQGSITVGQEHFASNVIRGRVMAIARGWDQGNGPRAVLACAPGEQHDLGLACHGLALRSRGWRVSYLGADTPIGTLAQTVATVDPEIVVIAAEMPGRLEAIADSFGELSEGATVAIGGRGTDEALAARLGALHLGGDPVSAAERLTRERGGRRLIASPRE